ncbi:MAG: DUF4340 domain-containing protein [Acidobacteriota bacterium]
MKRVVLLLAAFVALGLFVYFYEIEGEKERQEAQELEESLFRVEEEGITFVQIKRPEEPDVLLEKQQDQWVLKQPIETGADQTTVDSLLSDIAAAKTERSLPESEQSLQQYGLDEPRLTLSVRAGDETRKLLVGNEDFTGNSIYVRFEDDPTVYLTSDSILTTADKELLDWRDKKVLAFDRRQVQKIEIQRPSGTLVLEKEGESWRLEEPIEEAADEATVGTLLSTLEFAQAETFVSEEAQNLEQYGLANARIAVRLREGGQDQWKVLELGEKQDENYLARNPDRSEVFTLKADVYDKLTQDLWQFRNRDLVTVSQDEVKQIAIRREGHPEIVIRREDTRWILEQPQSQEGKEAVSYTFWYPLTDIDFESLDAGAEIEAPDIAVVITLNDNSVRTYHFAQRGEQHLASHVESGRTGTISAENFEKLQIDAEQLVE